MLKKRILVTVFSIVLIFSMLTPGMAAVKVRYPNWQWAEAGFKEIFTEVAQQFAKENPGAEIDGYVVAPSEYYDKLTIEMKAGNPPDIVMLRDSNIAQFIAMNELAPLGSWLKKTGIAERFVPAQQVVGVKNGEPYGMIAFAKSWQLLYNKKLFNEANVKVPTTPTEFLDAAQKLTISEGGRIVQYGFATMTLDKAPLYTYMLPWVTGMGGNFVKDGKSTATDKKTIQGVTLYKEFFDKRVIPVGVEEPVYRQLFWEGKVAMLLDGPWIIQLVEAKNPALYPYIGVAPLPFAGKGQYGTAGFNLLGVPKNAKNKELALKYLEILARPEYQKKFLEYTNLAPGAKDSVSASYSEKKPWFGVFSKGIENGVPITPPGLEAYYLEYETLIQKHISKMLFNNIPPKKAMANLDKELKEFIAKKTK